MLLWCVRGVVRWCSLGEVAGCPRNYAAFRRPARRVTSRRPCRSRCDQPRRERHILRLVTGLPGGLWRFSRRCAVAVLSPAVASHGRVVGTGPNYFSVAYVFYARSDRVRHIAPSDCCLWKRKNFRPLANPRTHSGSHLQIYFCSLILLRFSVEVANSHYFSVSRRKK